MGQYFKAVNLSKKEVVCPWCLCGGAKLWEWAANPQGAIFTLLLRKSDKGGGGDYYGYAPQNLSVDASDPKGAARTLAEAVRRTVILEGQPVTPPDETIVGRWAGDHVILVGDYDSSKTWDHLPGYRNISEGVVRAWNDFIELREMKLTYKPDCSCRKEETSA
jgi:hypothetical protein